MKNNFILKGHVEGNLQLKKSKNNIAYYAFNFKVEASKNLSEATVDKEVYVQNVLMFKNFHSVKKINKDYLLQLAGYFGDDGAFIANYISNIERNKSTQKDIDNHNKAMQRSLIYHTYFKLYTSYKTLIFEKYRYALPDYFKSHKQLAQEVENLQNLGLKRVNLMGAEFNGKPFSWPLYLDKSKQPTVKKKMSFTEYINLHYHDHNERQQRFMKEFLNRNNLPIPKKKMNHNNILT